MSGLSELLTIGASTLAAAQLAEATTGNNVANASTPGYSRQRVDLTEAPSVEIGQVSLPSGVQMGTIERLRSVLLDAQRRTDNQELSYSQAQSQVLSQVTSLFGSADHGPLLTALDGLFAAFGDLAAHPQDLGVRQTVLAQGQAFADAILTARTNLTQLEQQTFSTVSSQVAQVNATATRLAAVNQSLVASPNDPALADERDRLIDTLSQLIGVRASIDNQGVAQVVVDGTGIQLVAGTQAATLGVTGTPTSGAVGITANGTALPSERGSIGGQVDLLNSTTAGLPGFITSVDQLAQGVIQAVNQVHASGAGLTLAQSVTGSQVVASPTTPLNAAGLPFPVTAGSLQLGIFNATGNLVSASSLAINPATMSLQSLATAISALPGFTATVAGGQLTISSTNPADRVAFGPDTSGILVALGLNGFFTGHDAASIAVSATLIANPSLVAAAQPDYTAGTVTPGDNRNAQALANLASTAFLSGKTQTAAGYLGAFAATVGATTQAAQGRADTQQALFNAADQQQQQVAGVNLDEEMANMVAYQHVYEAGAKYIATVNTMMSDLINMLQ